MNRTKSTQYLAQRTGRRVLPCVLPLLLFGMISGCQDGSRRSSADRAEDRSLEAQRDQVSESLERYASSLAVRGTIGEVTWIEGMRRMDVRGYGLVIGLGANGSRTCPERIRRTLASAIRKEYRLGDSRIGLGHLTPEAIIDSPDTAVVQVNGEIGAASLASTRFDLTIRALEGTETLSLEGGRLYSCDLRYYRPTAPGVVQEGAVLASGKGPVFINPFANRKDSATPVNPRVGKIIGGGLNLRSRKVHLMLNSPSHALAHRIQDRINARYGMGDRIASAVSPSKIALDIPNRYADDELNFLALVRHTYINIEGAAADRRAQELAQEILDSQAPHDSISLAWEAMGKTVRPIIRELYSNNRDYVRYYAARAGLRTDDRLAAKVVAQTALNTQSLFQVAAIRELGNAMRMSHARDTLLEIVTSNMDPRIRILAYEGLVKQLSPLLTTVAVGNNFIMDQCPAGDGPAMIYASVSGSARLAIFGRPVCQTPMFYHHPQGLVTMNAVQNAETITTVRTTPSGLVSPEADAPTDAFELVRFLGKEAGEDRFDQVVGLGLSYSQIVALMATLCDNGVIDAQFHMQEPEDFLITTPERLGGRPESEL